MAPADRLLEATAKIVVHGDPKVGSTIELYNANNTGVRVWHWSILPPDESVDQTAVLVAEPAQDPFAGALRLLESSTYAGFVVAAQTADGGTMVCAKDTTAKFRARVDEQMALRDSGAASDDGEDRPSTAVAQLRELANWLRAQGEGTKADDADELAEAIAFKYEVV